MDEKYLEMAEQVSAAEVTAGLARARILQIKPEGFDGNCECGQEIQSGRIALGYFNCVRCQEKEERTAATHARR